MEDKKQYLRIMSESLQKKDAVLQEIKEANDEQTDILNQESVDWDAFDRNADRKMELISQLEKLDEGFESVYNNIKDMLADDAKRSAYQQEIRQMKQQITQLTEKSMSIQAAEARNKKLVEAKFALQRQEIRSGRISSKVAMDYYQNMRQTSVISSQFLDSKQ